MFHKHVYLLIVCLENTLQKLIIYICYYRKKIKNQNVLANGPLASEEDFPALPQRKEAASSNQSPTVMAADRKDSLEGEISWESEGSVAPFRKIKEEKKAGTRYSPILGSVVRPAKGVSPVNLHKQLEMISARKMLMSPPVAMTTPKPRASSQGEVTAPVGKPKQSLTNEESKGKGPDNEIETMVNDLIKDQIGESLSEDFDHKKATEELKAFLHIMPIDPENRPLVEAVIDRKMSELVGGKVEDEIIGDIVEGRSDSRKESEVTGTDSLENGTKESEASSDKKDLESFSETESKDSFDVVEQNFGMRKQHKSSSSKYSNDSELDLEKIEDSVLSNDFNDSVEMEKNGP